MLKPRPNCALLKHLSKWSPSSAAAGAHQKSPSHHSRNLSLIAPSSFTTISNVGHNFGQGQISRPLSTTATANPSVNTASDGEDNLTTTILHVYQSRVQLGQLKDDPHQIEVIKQLQRLDDDLQNYTPESATAKSLLDLSIFSKFFGSKSNELDSDDEEPKVRGLYLYGDVGCGKTMLMDLFYDNCGVDRRLKRRIHFHAFMLEFHSRLHRYKSQHKSDSNRPAFHVNPIPALADEIVKESWLLCLDEFQVTDIGDAIILRHLFKELFERGTVLVATSNRQPDDLYKNGLQRTTFLPFIPMLKQHCQVYQLQSGIDYRRLITSSEHQVYFVKDNESDEKLELMFKVFANNETDRVRPKTLTIKGRHVNFRKTCGGVLDTTFEELCNQPLGAIDYLTISQAFHTVLVRDIPHQSVKTRMQSRRFITMIDTFYDHHIRVIFSAEVPAEELFSSEKEEGMETSDDNRRLMDDLGIQLGKSENAKASIFSGEEELFAFDRTLSRIAEMQTSGYWNYKRVD